MKWLGLQYANPREPTSFQYANPREPTSFQYANPREPTSFQYANPQMCKCTNRKESRACNAVLFEDLHICGSAYWNVVGD